MKVIIGVGVHVTLVMGRLSVATSVPLLVGCSTGYGGSVRFLVCLPGLAVAWPVIWAHTTRSPARALTLVTTHIGVPLLCLLSRTFATSSLPQAHQ